MKKSYSPICLLDTRLLPLIKFAGGLPNQQYELRGYIYGRCDSNVIDQVQEVLSIGKCCMVMTLDDKKALFNSAIKLA